MRLLSMPASPYSAKARMAAVLCDIGVEKVAVDTGAEPEELTSANPLGKIPVLILDDGTALYDSRVICEYLDRTFGNPIVPQGDAEWREAKRLEATADGVLDAAILVLYEGRFRPEEKHHAPWTDRQWRKALRGLAILEAEIGEVPARPTIGHLSVAALTSWLDLRFAGKWEAAHPRLRQWNADFFAAFPALDAVKPRL
ncbi:glutathione S-transferase [Aureimonas endophytica]|uniref:Glutathione S-transferase n=1 Tax=Aureimonas endophytica TaxID=2027858 RepID=A0A916ZBW4_9HYPH|nr:glutathione S-transferase family protein [Aureimonas endophytica]GGD85807.1 glutathione S-transferase [Aureimonas endophytica]